MHRSRCFAASAEGGFKIINGPPRVGKGPMNHGDSLGPRDETSPPQPTQAGRTRLETCQEMIEEAMRCLENNEGLYNEAHGGANQKPMPQRQRSG